MQRRIFLGVMLLAVLVALPTTAQARLNPNPKWYTAQLSGDIVSGEIPVTNHMGLTAGPPLHGTGSMTFNAIGDSLWDQHAGPHGDADIWIQVKTKDGTIAVDWDLLLVPNSEKYGYRYMMNGAGIKFVQSKATKVWTATLVNYPLIIRDYGDPLSGLPNEYTVYLSFTLTVY